MIIKILFLSSILTLSIFYLIYKTLKLTKKCAGCLTISTIFIIIVVWLMLGSLIGLLF